MVNGGPRNDCPKRQCRGRRDHSTIGHWTPVYLSEVSHVVKAHALGRCRCRRSLVGDLVDITWGTLTYFVREHRHR
jgi:hypothetical protein